MRLHLSIACGEGPDAPVVSQCSICLPDNLDIHALGQSLADAKSVLLSWLQTARVHSDNGSPMKGETTLATMQRLGVAHSRSRAAVSTDNPCSESLFKTLKTSRPQPARRRAKRRRRPAGAGARAAAAPDSLPRRDGPECQAARTTARCA